MAVGNGVCKSRNMTTESVFKNSIWIAKALIYREKVWGRRETSSHMKINVDKLYFSFTFYLISSRDSDTRFSPLSFFINQFTLDPWVSYWDHFEFFRKFAEIFANECLSAVSTTEPSIFLDVALRSLWMGFEHCQLINRGRLRRTVISSYYIYT